MHWYVMHSKPQKELFLYKQLDLMGFNVYLPLVRKTRKNSQFEGLICFFPGYLFVCLNDEEEDFSRLRWIPGSQGIICFGGEPASIPDQFIQLLKIKVAGMNQFGTLHEFEYEKGDRVDIHSGFFEGYTAVFNEYLPSSDRIRLLLSFAADKLFKIEIPARQVKAAI